MGWWKMDAETGGIACSPPSGKPAGVELLNAIPGRDTVDDHYGGDAPADIMGNALRDIAACWQKHWGRPPCLDEIDGVFAFCMGRHRKVGHFQDSTK